MPSDALPDDLETLKAMLLAEQCENERLRQIIKEMQRHRFGRRAETLPEDQMLLGLEDVEQTAASDAATRISRLRPSDSRRLAKRRAIAARCRRICRGLRPSSTSTTRPARCCQGELHRIGEDKSERLDIVPAQFRVLVTRSARNTPAGVARMVWCRPRRRRG